MATRKIASLVLTAVLVAAACSERAKPEAVAPSASAAKPAAAPTQRKPVDVPAARPQAPGDTGSPAGAPNDEEWTSLDDDIEALASEVELVQKSVIPEDPAELAPVEPGPGAYRGPGDATPGSRTGPGTLRGIVRSKVVPPEVKPLSIDAAAAQGCAHAGSVDATDRSLLVDAQGGLANVVLTIKLPGRAAQPAPQPIVLDQKGCRFDPHVTVVSAGSRVSYANSDSISHNVHLYPKRNEGMNKLIATGASEEQLYDKEDQIEIKCDIHPWMNAWVIVTTAPASALSGADGSFEIKGLPPGTWELSLWHEKLGRSSQAVSIEAGSVTEVEIEIGGRATGSRRRR